MSIRHIQFRGDVAVSVGGKYTTISSWIIDKHGESIRVEVTPDWVYLYPTSPSNQKPSRRKIPMSSVAYIDEDFEPVKETKK